MSVLHSRLETPPFICLLSSSYSVPMEASKRPHVFIDEFGRVFSSPEADFLVSHADSDCSGENHLDTIWMNYGSDDDRAPLVSVILTY